MGFCFCSTVLQRKQHWMSCHHMPVMNHGTQHNSEVKSTMTNQMIATLATHQVEDVMRGEPCCCTVLHSKHQRQDLHSLAYIHTCSVLMSSLPFTGYLKSHKCERPKKDTFLVHSSHNFSLHLRENELRYHCCLSQLYFLLGTSFLLQQKDRVAFTVEEY
jgi:hypothetical protein